VGGRRARIAGGLSLRLANSSQPPLCPGALHDGMYLLSRPTTNAIATWAGLAGLWLFVGFALSMEVYFNLRVSGETVAFVEVAKTQYARALFWALLAPAVLWLRVKVPLTAGRFAGGVAFHLAVSLAVMGGYYLARTSVVLFLETGSLAGYWEVATSTFFGRNLIDAGFYWAVLAAGYSSDLYRRFKSEELKAAQLESRLIETELKALKQQLQPHFLFNTMNTIAVLVREGRNDDAVSLLAKLSGLLRMSLDLAGVHEVTLRQELEFISRYVEIQKVRFADRLTVTMRMGPEVLDAKIPNLLLQPLVENAIIHGIAPKTGPGSVEILGRLVQGRLELEVKDDGCGFAPTGAEGLPARMGIGLSNTRERLAKLYGERAEFTVRGEPGRGAGVRLAFPFRT
jgi:two-component system, LytTR family, sensor kinase